METMYLLLFLKPKPDLETSLLVRRRARKRKGKRGGKGEKNGRKSDRDFANSLTITFRKLFRHVSK